MNTKIVHIKNNSKKASQRWLVFLLCEGVLNERAETSI